MLGDGEVMQGRCVSNDPKQIQFPGAPVPGLSGSPIFNSGQNVVGIYSNHILDEGSHICVPYRGDWTHVVINKLKEKKKINTYTTCGAGKSTILPISCLESGVAIKELVVVPRGALVHEIAKRLGSMARGFAGDQSIEDHDCKILVITHGKLLEALDRNPTRFASYDTVFIDEAHDLSALTRAAMEWAESSDKQVVFMTGSPNSEEFTKKDTRCNEVQHGSRGAPL
jgi:late competence protein required for DNA uptake (superfamily II DNA/RNA helicase)